MAYNLTRLLARSVGVGLDGDGLVEDGGEHEAARPHAQMAVKNEDARHRLHAFFRNDSWQLVQRRVEVQYSTRGCYRDNRTKYNIFYDDRRESSGWRAVVQVVHGPAK